MIPGRIDATGIQKAKSSSAPTPSALKIQNRSEMSRESVNYARMEHITRTKSVPNAMHPAQLANRRINALHARTDSQKEATQNCAKSAILMSL